MVQSLVLGRGALSALVLIAAGEATSALQNSWYLARIMRAHSPVRLSLGVLPNLWRCTLVDPGSSLPGCFRML